jgi:hypothetical protein
MQFVFSEIKHGECILVPGTIVVMERMEQTGSLPEYMHDHLDWIGSTFARRHRLSMGSLFTDSDDQGFVRRICALSTSLLTILQLCLPSRVSYTYRAHREDRSLGYRRQHFVRSRQKFVV